MKKVLLLAFVVFASSFTFAQDAFKEDVLKLIKKSGATAQMEMAKKQIMEMIPEAKHAEFSKEFDSTMPALYEKMVGVYKEEFTHDEVKELLKFYETPAGKKMGEKSGVLFEKSMAAAQDWGQSLQAIMMKYM